VVLAVHLLGAGDPIRAAGYYEQAARQAAEALAFDRAVKLYRLVLELRPGGPEEERRLRERLADALAGAGHGAEAARQYQAAAEGAAPAEWLGRQRRAALQFLSSGHVDAGLAALRAVLSRVGMSLPESPRRAFWPLVWQRVWLRLRGLRFRRRAEAEVPARELERLDVCTAAAQGLSMVNTVQGAYFQSRSLLLALRAGEPGRLVSALAIEAAHESIGGTRCGGRCERLLGVAEALADELGKPHLRATVSLARGIAAALAGDWRRALGLCDGAEATFRESCTGVMWELGTAHRFALWPLVYLGELAEVGRRLPGLIREAEERDDLYNLTTVLVGRTMVLLAADDPAGARRELGEVMGRWSRQGFHVQHMNRLVDEVQIDLYQGRGPTAWGRVTGHWPLIARSHLLQVQQVRILLGHLRARAALAAALDAPPERAAFLRAARREARALWREGAPWGRALAQLLRAGAAAVEGSPDRAAELLRDAARRCEATDMRLYAATARRRLGEVLGGAEGGALVEEADAWMAGQRVVNPARMTALLAPGFTQP
jgi:tetratricopeptide (TPR) repeat protein